MSTRFFGCSKFRRLVGERDDRKLSTKEGNYVERHRLVCDTCRRSERQFAAALNMLRSATLEPEPESHFDQRVMRRIRLNNAREKFEYWSPAFAGAAIACIAIFAAMQMISRSSELPQFKSPQGEAVRTTKADQFPTLLLRSNRNDAPRR